MRKFGGLILLSACLAGGCGDPKTDRLDAGRDAIVISEDNETIVRWLNNRIVEIPAGTKIRVVNDRSHGKDSGEVDVLILEGTMRDQPSSFPRKNLKPVS